MLYVPTTRDTFTQVPEYEKLLPRCSVHSTYTQVVSTVMNTPRLKLLKPYRQIRYQESHGDD